MFFLKYIFTTYHHTKIKVTVIELRNKNEIANNCSLLISHIIIKKLQIYRLTYRR